MTPDTSAEAVERRIRELHEAGFDNAAATLRALPLPAADALACAIEDERLDRAALAGEGKRDE